MGFGDFVKGIGEAAGNVGGAIMEAGGDVGEAVGGDWVVDQALKAPDAARHVYKAGEGLVKGAAYIGDPGHWDDVGRGIVGAANYVIENPGQTWDVGFEVGRAIVKDQLDPVNLAINAGLIAATVATGGAAAPALVAKVGLGLKSARAGVSAVRAGEGLVEGYKAARTANTALRAVRSADKALDVVKDVERVADAVDTAKDTTAVMSRGDAFLGGTNVAGEATRGSRALNPISRHAERIMQSKVRDPLATKILAGGRAGDEASAGRQIMAAIVQGNTGARPVALARQSDRAIGLQRTMWRGRQVAKKTVGYAQTAGSVQTGYDIAYDPAGYAEGKAEAGWAEHGDEITAEAEKRGLTPDQLRQRREKGGEEAAKEEKSYDPFEQPVATPIPGMMDFRLNNTRSTKTSKRMPNQPAALGTVTKESTMPSQIGPSDWYGPQPGYKAGRGFASKTASALPPLEQPRLGAQTAGVA